MASATIRTVFVCKNCEEEYTHPCISDLGPRFNKCPFCGKYIQLCPPKRTYERWVRDGFKGWWIFKKEIGHWEPIR